MIHQDTIKSVTDAIDIVSLIGEYVKLKKRGANYIGLSPFANERTPSFTVSPAKGIFKDFSTGKGGSGITFIMEHEHISYREAIILLAKKYGIEVKEDREATDEQIAAGVLSDSIYKANEIAASIFHEFLMADEEAKKYFFDRGFDDDVIQKWQLGFSGPRKDSFTTTALSRHLTEDILIKSDLTIRSESGVLRDKYIDRLIFPFHTLSGRIPGFSGRQRVTNKEYPKYTNTSENEVFKKRELWYGIYLAKKAIQKEDNCNIVEGQADVIAMHRDGFENTVGSGGTALTREHIRMLKRFCSRVTFIYDNDPAGVKATGRGIELCVEEGLSVDILVLPTGEDPDSYLLKYGAEEFKSYYDANLGDIVDFYMGDGKSITEKEKNERGRILLNLLAVMGTHDIWRRRAKVMKLHKLFNADIQEINAAIDKIKVQPSTLEPNIATISTPKSYPHEVEFVKNLLRYGALEYPGQSQFVYLYMLNNNSEENFRGEIEHAIIKDYWECLANGFIPDVDRYAAFPDENISSLATSILFEDYNISQSWVGVHELTPEYKNKVRTSVAFFKVHLTKEAISQNELLISNCTDPDRLNELMESNRILKSNFRLLASRAGVSLML